METSPETASTKKIVRLESLKADLQKEREGDWIKAVDLDPNIRWFVRSTNFPDFRLARDAAMKKLGEKYGSDPIPDDVNAEVMGKLAVEHLLLGWEGLDAGYTPEAAAEILTDEAYRKVRYSIYIAASRVGTSEVQYVGNTAKN
ncbi:hypothetical protein J4G48_0015535 [Bradyrhizobium barranii subsp. apii]|uniref:hypothetical protein n=1 Tax=Bradyrhizobium barranii TaxID=2992140 RepID=UPI001AA1BD7E|nr:hypothetical protein [Bradyrhizobium barranii]UPT99376.1 hypothetical protein J4G48_0015535 [Bradyrhizobium barranii subsp. apii]